MLGSVVSNPMHPAADFRSVHRDLVGNIFSILPAMKRWIFGRGENHSKSGDIELVEDLARPKATGTATSDLRTVWCCGVPIADQTVVRGFDFEIVVTCDLCRGPFQRLSYYLL